MPKRKAKGKSGKQEYGGTVRLPEAEYRDLAALSAESGLSMTNYATRLVRLAKRKKFRLDFIDPNGD